eukprot:CAMPEP_0175841486 /NCGR_PEP_ID=MMETSP0107_2-20121207/19961_1 /TAXON_ID=195067 ORGANISM="Goniomonas pacifica, Strain CCMP1869" /NCGR_SAMPLE_ID=MMETSP0107_2 /ASSEMBLY_ACC=CAM_ASM_000203 /LENGTH=48 /DNA_ID= /DNA_START= /DNA_END= /DNA_ORIENTATION=
MSSQAEHLQTVVAAVGDEHDVGSHVQRHIHRALQLSDGAPPSRAKGPE